MTTFRIPDPALVPEDFKILIRSVWDEPGTPLWWEIDEAKIRAALEEKCERRHGYGLIRPAAVDCPVCHGSGLRQIPGVERIEENNEQITG